MAKQTVVQDAAQSEPATERSQPTEPGKALATVTVAHGVELRAEQWSKAPELKDQLYEGYSGLSENLSDMLAAKGFTIRAGKSYVGIYMGATRFKTATPSFFRSEEEVRKFLLESENIRFEKEKDLLINKAVMDGILRHIEKQAAQSKAQTA
ncbi:MAG: hypothetical protein M1351_02335 [Candidatus Thermoplasmatota archaeon]|nr:hypothetical protein [Candidatus Thermoplasmatota archaeon]